MFVFADGQAYEDIMLQKESNPEFDELVIRKVDDAADVLEALKPLDPAEDVAVFLGPRAYRGAVVTVAVKIATEAGLI